MAANASNGAEAQGDAGLAVRDIVWLVLVSLMLFVMLLPFSSYVAALAFIQREWGLNNTQAGVVFSAYLAGFAASALFTLPLTDRLGSKHILLVSATVSVVANVLFPLMAHGMTAAILLRAVAGMGLVGVYNPGMRVISERFPTRGRGMAIGMFVTAFYASNAVSLSLTGVLMDRMEWRNAYLLMASASAASVPLAYFLLRGHRQQRSSQSSWVLDPSVLRNRAARIFIFGYSLHAVELYVVRIWLPAFLMATLVARGVDDGKAAVTAATVGGIALAMGSVGPVMGGIVSDRWGRARTAAAIFALSGACGWAIGWLGALPWALIVGVSAVYGWAIAADSAIYSTAVTEVGDRQKLGSTLAMHSFIGFVGGVIGPILVGGVLDLAPDSVKWGAGFSLMGLLAVVAVLALSRTRSLPARATSGQRAASAR